MISLNSRLQIAHFKRRSQRLLAVGFYIICVLVALMAAATLVSAEF